MLDTKRLIFGQMIIILFLFNILLSLNKNIEYSLLISIVSSCFFIVWTKMVSGDYTNITLFFVVFGTLYGLSGPIAVVWGTGLPSIFTVTLNIEVYLISYALSCIGLIVGITIYNIIHSRNRLENSIICRSLNEFSLYIENFFKIGIFLITIGTLFEVINLLRIGGFNLLFSGKAKYQSFTADLFLTLPSFEFVILGFSLIGLYIGTLTKIKSEHNRKNFISLILLIILSSFPYLIIKIVLGQRGILVSIFLSILIGVTYFKPIKKLKLRFIFILTILYLFLSFLYANRAIIKIIPENPTLFFELAFSQERIIKSLNPATNEFGATFGNFATYYNKYQSDFPPRLGETYIKGLVLPIPSFIYPGTKPQQITYEFRDEFFSSEASRGSIAGTGFSSILEAYMNFKNVGVFLVYLIIGYIIQKIDRYYRFRNLFFTIVYISLFSQTISFHRSAFGTFFAIFVMISILTIIVMLSFKLVKYNISKKIV